MLLCKRTQFTSFHWFPLVKIMQALTTDCEGKWQYDKCDRGDSDNRSSASDNETFDFPCIEAKDPQDSSDTIEMKKAQEESIRLQKQKENEKAQEDSECVPKHRTKEKDLTFTSLVRIDKNDSRIPNLFSLTSSFAAWYRSGRCLLRIKDGKIV